MTTAATMDADNSGYPEFFIEDNPCDKTLSASVFPVHSAEIEDWEFVLDSQLGPTSSFEALAAHLAKAPEGAPSKEILSDYVLAKQVELKQRQAGNSI